MRTGNLFLDAINKYNELENVYKAKAFMEIYNYADEHLAGNKNYIDWGLTSQLPDIINGGYKEGITLYQNIPTRGLEGVVSYALPGGYRIYIYVKVGQKLIGRKENQLGVCITQNTASSIQFSEDWYERMISDNSPCMRIHDEFATSPRTLQCCRGVYCVQASMTSSNHANVNVRVFPISVRDFAFDLPKDLGDFDQDDLDHILDVEGSCNSPGKRDTVPPPTTTTTTTTTTTETTTTTTATTTAKSLFGAHGSAGRYGYLNGSTRLDTMLSLPIFLILMAIHLWVNA